MIFLKIRTLFSKRKTFLILLSIWIIVLVISVPFLSMTEFNADPNQCFLNMSKNDLIYVFSFNIVLIILPTIGLFIFYLMIIVQLKKREVSFGKIKYTSSISSNLGSYLLNSKSTPKKLDKKRRFTIILSMISVLFYCFQLPTRLFLCWSFINDRMEIKYASIDSQSLESFS